jgi:hypothetical protein
MRALRSVANADDEGIANEDRGPAVADLAVHEMGWARHHEQLVAIDVELWQLVRSASSIASGCKSQFSWSWRNSASLGSNSPIQTNSERSVAQRTG